LEIADEFSKNNDPSKVEVNANTSEDPLQKFYNKNRKTNTHYWNLKVHKQY
jgi:hypothetical protein